MQRPVSPPARQAQPIQPDQPPKQPFKISEQQKQGILWILFAIWAVLVTVGIANHEQWRDEGSDWLTVRHVGIGELFGTMIPQIGHPPLYYFLMYPLGNLGLPLVTVNIITALIMAVAMYLMLFRLKFPYYLKLALIFCMFFVYEYPVVGRNYSLVVLFLMLTLWFYPRRFERPLLFALIMVCLFNTHSMVFPLAFGVWLLYCWELVEFKKLNARTGIAAALIFIGGMYLIPYMALPGMRAVSDKLDIPDHYAQFKTAVGNGLTIGGLEGISVDVMQSFALLAFVVFFVLMAQRLKPFAVMLCGIGGLLFLLTYKYIGQHRHHGLIMVEMLFVYGLSGFYKQDKFTLEGFAKYRPKRIAGIVLAVILFIQSYHGISGIKNEVDTIYSDSKAAAEFLKENKLEHKILVGHQSWAASSVLQHLPADCKMYWADTKRWGYFIKFDSLYMANKYAFSGDYAAAVAEQQFGDSLKDVVLVMNIPLQDPRFTSHWKVIYAGGEFVNEAPVKRQESYLIYTYH